MIYVLLVGVDVVAVVRSENYRYRTFQLYADYVCIELCVMQCNVEKPKQTQILFYKHLFVAHEYNTLIVKTSENESRGKKAIALSTFAVRTPFHIIFTSAIGTQRPANKNRNSRKKIQ